MELTFRKANKEDIEVIWEILQQAIARRKAEGSKQWQDGYPNPQVIEKDIDSNAGYVLVNDGKVVGYCALFINDEPAYSNIEGNWLSNGDFVVFHRVAISENYLGKGLAKKMMSFIEEFAINNNIQSIKADTNFDNAGMLAIFNKLGYKFCGEVTFRGTSRKAFEKLLILKN
ncbi:GNAT family N-acetyltransferase [Apibacter muscae]|uniref:GNAT family N-acetyltransferase n=1 Tax=Apibacter muscae TaxID=2509004 RepID=A0A563D8P1_9FLAO|nr:GNAT family N-acetyltransferase [Apibacter muscae]TWP26565.1 GNAT family N-acetyltransferase [Apibacter muscae]